MHSLSVQRSPMPRSLEDFRTCTARDRSNLQTKFSVLEVPRVSGRGYQFRRFTVGSALRRATRPSVTQQSRRCNLINYRPTGGGRVSPAAIQPLSLHIQGSIAGLSKAFLRWRDAYVYQTKAQQCHLIGACMSHVTACIFVVADSCGERVPSRNRELEKCRS